MADQQTPPVHGREIGRKTGRETREQALARALRDNLRRRKAPPVLPPGPADDPSAS